MANRLYTAEKKGKTRDVVYPSGIIDGVSVKLLKRVSNFFSGFRISDGHP
jgi:hypothetical protein